MAEISAESVVFVAGGAATGAGVSATIGGMGLAGSFGAVGIGMAPVTAAGTVAGAAAYGAFKAITDGDTSAFGAIGIGAAAGAGVSATVGGMGLAGSFGAVGIGMGTMAAAGGVVGLGVYGLYKLVNRADTASNYYRNMQVLADITREYEEKRRWNNLEVEAELEMLKRQMQTLIQQTNEIDSELEALKTEAETKTFVQAKSAPSSPFNAPEIETEILEIALQPPQNWKCLKVLKGHEASVNIIAISSDGQTLVSGSQDRTVSLWNLKTGKRTFTFFGQAGEVYSVAISPDGKMLVAGGFDNKITSWQLDTKALACSFFARNSPYSHSGFVSSLAFSRDRRILASASGDKTIRLWGGYTGELKRTLN